MDLGEQQSVATLTGVAVAIVALSRFVGSTHPDLAPFLNRALASATGAGLAAADLTLLETIIAAIGMR